MTGKTVIRFSLYAACAALMVLCLGFAVGAVAQNPPLPPAQAPQCTTAAVYYETNGADLINGALNEVNNVLTGATSSIYAFIRTDPRYTKAIAGVVTLYIAIYAIMIMFQLAPVKPGEMITRAAKIAFLVFIISPVGWAFFNLYVRGLFLMGMNELITIFNNLALGTLSAPPPPGSVAGVADIIATPIGAVLSTRMMYTLVATFFTGSFGFVFALMIIWSLATFLFAVLAALGTYVKALVGLFFLFSLAPIFFAFLLFDATRKMFDGWINMIVKFTLQPIFVFSFLGFFFLLIMVAIQGLLSIPVCYVNLFTVIGVSGDWGIGIWRFALPEPSAASGFGVYDGGWGSCGPENYCSTPTGCTNCAYDTFPIDIRNVIFLTISSWLAFKYTMFIEQIASKITNVSSGVGVSGPQAKGWFKSRGLTPEQIAPKVALGTAALVARGGVGVGKIGWNLGKRATGKGKGPEGDTVRPNASNDAAMVSGRGGPGGRSGGGGASTGEEGQSNRNNTTRRPVPGEGPARGTGSSGGSGGGSGGSTPESSQDPFKQPPRGGGKR